MTPIGLLNFDIKHTNTKLDEQERKSSLVNCSNTRFLEKVCAERRKENGF